MFVPKQLDYNQLQTKAFFSVYKQWTLNPTSTTYFPGEIVKIYFNSLGDGVMDPYLSHLEITVSTDEKSLPVGLLQVDNSAQSFIDTMIISSNNREVQRIVQSSVLAAYLNDIGLKQQYAQGRQVQGFGYNNIDNYASIYTRSYNSGMPFVVTDFNQQNKNMVTMSSQNVFPTIPQKNTIYSAWGDDGINFGCLNDRSHITRYNSAWLTEQKQVFWWDAWVSGDAKAKVPNPLLDVKTIDLKYYGYLQNIRGQYLANYAVNDSIDTNNTLSKTQIMLDPAVQNNKFPAYFDNGTVYKTKIPAFLGYRFQQPTQEPSAQQLPNINSLLGYTHLYSPLFAKGVRQPFISPTVPQLSMKNGVFLPQKQPLSFRTFKIPLLSAIMGLLIPKNQFVLLPLRAFNETILQFTIDPYAMFTSGYNDISQYDITGMGLMQKRAFTITNIVYNLHTYQFYNPQVDEYLRTSLRSGIAINTNYWQLANQYKIDDSGALAQAFIIACNQQALNEIVTLFMPADYVNFSFCRKHFRISNNITKMQFRMNMDYFPSMPLTGNAGNPIAADVSGDNSIFLEQIALMRGNRFDKNQSRINAYNFAINDRPYNILNTHSLYDPSMINQHSYNWNSASVNYDTAMGMPYTHENRCVGKAAFVFSFAPYSHSKNLLTGIDCRGIKTFNLLLGTSPDNQFRRPQQMYIFTRSSNIIEYTQGNIRNINK